MEHRRLRDSASLPPPFGRPVFCDPGGRRGIKRDRASPSPSRTVCRSILAVCKRYDSGGALKTGDKDPGCKVLQLPWRATKRRCRRRVRQRLGKIVTPKAGIAQRPAQQFQTSTRCRSGPHRGYPHGTKRHDPIERPSALAPPRGAAGTGLRNPRSSPPAGARTGHLASNHLASATCGLR